MKAKELDWRADARKWVGDQECPEPSVLDKCHTVGKGHSCHRLNDAS